MAIGSTGFSGRRGLAWMFGAVGAITAQANLLGDVIVTSRRTGAVAGQAA